MQKHYLSLAVLSAMGASLAMPAHANDEILTDNSVIEEVIVTGSHIKGLDLEGATNAVEISGKDIMESGADSLVTLLDSLSVTGGGNGTFTTEGSGPGSDQNPVGASAVSLRGLGTSSTLTLVNGRRVSVSSFAKGGTESFVDINSIPLAAIERIEILPSGASALYGADAVAGVVNIILKKDYEGLALSGSYGNSTASSDDGKTNLNLTWGKKTDNTHSLLVVDYFKRNPLFERDRSATALSRDPSADSNFVALNSSGVYLDDAIEEAECAAAAGDRVSPGDSQYGRACFYNTNDVISAVGESESIGITGAFDYTFSNMTWFNEFMYQSNSAKGNRAGSPWELALSPYHPGWTNEQALIDAIEANYAAADGDGYNAVGGLTAEQVLDLIENDSDTWGDAANDYFYTMFGRFDDPREVEVETESVRFVSGLNGKFESWNWETAFSVGQSQSTQTGVTGLYNREAVQAALLGNLCNDGSIVSNDYSINGDIAEKENVDFGGDGVTCESLGKTTVWYDPFNGQYNQDQNVLNLITADASRQGESKLYAWDVKASSLDLLDLPAGQVAGAFGAEWRKEEVKDTPSEESKASNDNSDPIISFSSTGAEYSRQQYAAYGELMIPLAEGLEAQVAGRYDHYDDFGDDVNGKVALRYELNDSLILRGNWSQSFRAPSMAQSGLTKKLTSYTAACDLSDPYTEALMDGFYCGVDGSDADPYTDPYDASRSMATELVGNANLKAETADTFGFGVLVRPTDDIELNIDWWRIEYNNTVVTEEDAYVVATLNGLTDGIVTTSDLNSGSPGVQLYCDPNNFTVETSDDCNASGTDYGPEIADVHFQPFNAGQQTVEGIDLVYTHYLYDGAQGLVTLFFDASYLLKFDQEVIEGYEKESLAGSFRYPRLAANTKVRWSMENWSTSISANYTGSYKDNLNGSDAAEMDGYDVDPSDGNIDSRTVPSWTTFDLSVSYDLRDKSYVQLSVRNLLDESPNFVYGSSSNVDYSNTDIMGRYITVRYNHVF